MVEEQQSPMDSNMRKFLEERRLSITDLTKKAQDKSPDALAARQQLRELAIKKREKELSQLTTEDYFESEQQHNFAFGYYLSEACF